MNGFHIRREVSEQYEMVEVLIKERHAINSKDRGDLGSMALALHAY